MSGDLSHSWDGGRPKSYAAVESSSFGRKQGVVWGLDGKKERDEHIDSNGHSRNKPRTMPTDGRPLSSDDLETPRGLSEDQPKAIKKGLVTRMTRG